MEPPHAGSPIDTIISADAKVRTYNIDRVDGRQINGRSLSFFTDDAEEGRMAQYGPAAQFSSAAEMLSYLKDMHQLANRQLVHDWKEQSGYRTKHVTDPDCTFLPAAQ